MHFWRNSNLVVNKFEVQDVLLFRLLIQWESTSLNSRKELPTHQPSVQGWGCDCAQGKTDEENIVGEVILSPNDAVEQAINMIVSELDAPPGFLLKKTSFQLPNYNSHEELLSFSTKNWLCCDHWLWCLILFHFLFLWVLPCCFCFVIPQQLFFCDLFVCLFVFFFFVVVDKKLEPKNWRNVLWMDAVWWFWQINVCSDCNQ